MDEERARIRKRRRSPIAHPLIPLRRNKRINGRGVKGVKINPRRGTKEVARMRTSDNRPQKATSAINGAILLWKAKTLSVSCCRLQNAKEDPRSVR
jgi:hypothetical protein